VLALRAASEDADEWPATAGSANELVAVAEAPPNVRLEQEALDDLAFYLARQRTLIIRHATGDRVVALIEIISPANKHTQQTLEQFADKASSALREGIHLVIIDVLPPGSHDPDGIHGYLWHRWLAGTYRAPFAGARTLVSYAASQPVRAYVEPLRQGDPLTDMPLFLRPTHYVNVPLEDTYRQAWAGVPRRWQRVIEEERS
jgi:hypothetical protein